MAYAQKFSYGTRTEVSNEADRLAEVAEQLLGETIVVEDLGGNDHEAYTVDVVTLEVEEDLLSHQIAESATNAEHSQRDARDDSDHGEELRSLLGNAKLEALEALRLRTAEVAAGVHEDLAVGRDELGHPTLVLVDGEVSADA